MTPEALASGALAIEPADDGDAEPLVALWRRSFEGGTGLVDPHPLADQLRFYRDQVLPRCTVRVARVNGALAGFIAFTPETVEQLYLDLPWQRRGIGTALLRQAQAGAKRLSLYTLASNRGARAFYERHGFRDVGHGHANMWGVEDVRYAWTAEGD